MSMPPVLFPLQTAVREYQAGDSCQTIAKRYGVSIGYVTLRMRRLGVIETNRRRDQHGEKNCMYKGGLSRSTINRQTKSILTEAGVDLTVCQACGRKFDRNLPRHHVDEDRSNNSLRNLVNLCTPCHMVRHPREHDELGRFTSK